MVARSQLHEWRCPKKVWIELNAVGYLQKTLNRFLRNMWWEAHMGTWRARAASTSTLPGPTALDTTRASGTGEPGGAIWTALWPTYTRAPASFRPSIWSFHARSDPLTCNPCQDSIWVSILLVTRPWIASESKRQIESENSSHSRPWRWGLCYSSVAKTWHTHMQQYTMEDLESMVIGQERRLFTFLCFFMIDYKELLLLNSILGVNFLLTEPRIALETKRQSENSSLLRLRKWALELYILTLCLETSPLPHSSHSNISKKKTWLTHTQQIMDLEIMVSGQEMHASSHSSVFVMIDYEESLSLFWATSSGFSSRDRCMEMSS